MDFINQLVLAGAFLLLLAILASALSYRMGMPLLLVFLAVGMLAGEDGPGGIVFNDAGIAYAVGSVALAIILLDGGLNTRKGSFRTGLRPALVLATAGVLLTCLATGLAAAWALDLTLMEGMLIGAVVGSTDAAAVFALLRAKGLVLRQRVASTLEIESGSNDPMAVFLTVAILELLLAGRGVPGGETLSLFLLQMGGGLVAGLAGGRLLVWLANRLPLERSMYPMLILAGGLTLYGLTTYLGGSGFLAIYLAGVVIGNLALRESRQVQHVHNGLAWLAQIAMFLMLGLLATPRELVDHALPALLLALALMFLARPLAVFLCLAPFRFPWREQVFIAWVGLRGAVPIILALFPLLAGLPVASLILDVAFFVVLVSLTVQGWTIAPLARWLKLEIPSTGTPVDRLELATPDRDQPAILGFRLSRNGAVTGRPAGTLDLPGKARLVTVLRRHRNLSPQDAGPLQAGDMVYVLADEEEAVRLGELFSPVSAPRHLEKRIFFGDLTLLGDAPLADVGEQYGLVLPPSCDRLSLGQYLAARLATRPAVGDRVRVEHLEFVVREITDGRISRVGLKFGNDKSARQPQKKGSPS